MLKCVEQEEEARLAEEERLRAEEERKREIEAAYLGNDPQPTSCLKTILVFSHGK